jgi:putative membrane protein
MSDKFIFRFVAAISVFVLLVVIILNRKIIPAPAQLPSFTYFLPKLNAILNGSCSVLLLISLYFIKKGNIAAHKRANILAFCLSSLFLVSYILFHYLAPETHFGGTGPVKYMYFFILITHIILAAGVLPLILLSFYRGLQMQVEKHRKLVRWTFPIWLYVTITGVVVYLMISPYYPIL